MQMRASRPKPLQQSLKPRFVYGGASASKPLGCISKGGTQAGELRISENMKKIFTRFTNKILDKIQSTGNALPHPATIFACLALLVIIISAISALAGWSIESTMINRSTLAVEEGILRAKSLMSRDGITYIFNNMVGNFMSFAPLGTVLVAMIGIGILEQSGLMQTLLRKVVISTNKRYITAVVVFMGVMSNLASDAGYVVLPPLAAIIFLSYGKHPIAGLCAAFAGVSGGFTANLLIGTLDPLLGGISTEAARMVQPDYEVAATANYYFMFVSTFMITILGTVITERVVIPRLGTYEGSLKFNFDKINERERKALRQTGYAMLPITLLVIGLWFILRESFFGSALVPICMFIFALPGVVYGCRSGSIKNDSDVMDMIGKALSGMGAYIALIFFAAQFTAFFSYSNLGAMTSAAGANLLKMSGFTGIPLILSFAIVVALLNLFIGSASAKWALIAPIFVPMFMQLDFTPEFTQLVYRLGDSSTNIITPMMPYFAMMLVFMQRYDKKARMGTLIAYMIPYSIAFFVCWCLLLTLWMLLNLPIGLNAAIRF